MIRSSPSIGIGITTKNRWADLAVTLVHLRDEGLDQLETIVIDDGSDSLAPLEFAQQFSWVRFERFEKSEGNLPRRNRLASLLSTEFYLSLDDDSYPVAGDLAAAAIWLHQHPSVAALAFRIILADDPLPVVTEIAPPILVKDFINCGVLLRRDLLVSLGGFETRLHFYHEEPDYAFRAFQKGCDNFAWPSVVIRHQVTAAARPKATRTRYFIRNVILLDLWYYPQPQSILRAIGHVPLLFLRMPGLRKHAGSFLVGAIEGFACYLKWWKLRKRLTAEQLKRWEARPSAVQVCLDSRTPV